MSKSITTQEQLNKFGDAVNLLYLTEMTKPVFQTKIVAIRAAAVAHGAIGGAVQERFRHNGIITKEDISDIASGAFRGMVISTQDPDTMRTLRGYSARFTEYLEQAFDIAVHDKPLPPHPPGIGESFSRI
jgi:hypothetical protein